MARYTPDHLQALADFYRDIWDPAATPARVAAAREAAAARNPVEPGQEPPTWILLENDRILGHLSTIPVLVERGDGRRRPGHWFIGFMVRPEYRNGPIGFLMLKEAARVLDLTLSLTVAQASIRLFKAVGFAELGIVPNYLRLLRPGRVLRRVDLDAVGLSGVSPALRRLIGVGQLPGLAEAGGLAARAALAGWSALRSPGGGAPRADGLGEVTDADRLWADAAPRLGRVAVRDGSYLAHRYPSGPEDPYAVVRIGSRPTRGLAFVRRPKDEGDPRLRGIRVATLSDWIFDPARPGDGAALLRGAESEARAMGADALLASVSHRAAGPLLAGRGYVRFPGNLMFLVRDNLGELPGPTTLADWWVSRGDMNADSVF